MKFDTDYDGDETGGKAHYDELKKEVDQQAMVNDIFNIFGAILTWFSNKFKVNLNNKKLPRYIFTVYVVLSNLWAARISFICNILVP